MKELLRLILIKIRDALCNIWLISLVILLINVNLAYKLYKRNATLSELGNIKVKKVLEIKEFKIDENLFVKEKVKAIEDINKFLSEINDVSTYSSKHKLLNQNNKKAFYEMENNITIDRLTYKEVVDILRKMRAQDYLISTFSIVNLTPSIYEMSENQGSTNSGMKMSMIFTALYKESTVEPETNKSETNKSEKIPNKN